MQPSWCDERVFYEKKNEKCWITSCFIGCAKFLVKCPLTWHINLDKKHLYCKLQELRMSVPKCYWLESQYPSGFISTLTTSKVQVTNRLYTARPCFSFQKLIKLVFPPPASPTVLPVSRTAPPTTPRGRYARFLRYVQVWTKLLGKFVN